MSVFLHYVWACDVEGCKESGQEHAMHRLRGEPFKETIPEGWQAVMTGTGQDLHFCPAHHWEPAKAEAAKEAA